MYTLGNFGMISVFFINFGISTMHSTMGNRRLKRLKRKKKLYLKSGVKICQSFVA